MRRVDGVEVELARPHAAAEAAPITIARTCAAKVNDRNNTAQKRDDRSAERRIQI